MSSFIDNRLDDSWFTCQTVEGSFHPFPLPFGCCSTMKFDVTTLRALSRITDRMDLIRKNPHRYEIDPEVLAKLGVAARQIEELLTKVTIIKAG